VALCCLGNGCRIAVGLQRFSYWEFVSANYGSYLHEFDF